MEYMLASDYKIVSSISYFQAFKRYMNGMEVKKKYIYKFLFTSTEFLICARKIRKKESKCLLE